LSAPFFYCAIANAPILELAERPKSQLIPQAVPGSRGDDILCLLIVTVVAFFEALMSSRDCCFVQHLPEEFG
jgi:hypothetical protein